ncbi:hypothetical protein CWI37_0205p0010 [Hamiltosporidium tvaerminnensis]|nr:hypothetical protein CWI37_0205p0010 [Hamiltosporidium tvaerminnensis]
MYDVIQAPLELKLEKLSFKIKPNVIFTVDSVDYVCELKENIKLGVCSDMGDTTGEIIKNRNYYVIKRV